MKRKAKRKKGDTTKIHPPIMEAAWRVDGMCEDCTHHANHNAPKKEIENAQTSEQVYDRCHQYMFCKKCSRPKMGEAWIEPLF